MRVSYQIYSSLRSFRKMPQNAKPRSSLIHFHAKMMIKQMGCAVLDSWLPTLRHSSRFQLPHCLYISAAILLRALPFTPPMLQYFTDSYPLIDIPIEHQSDEIDTRIAHNIRNAQVMIHNLVDAVERVLLVDDCVEEDAQGPDVLLLAAVGLTG